MRSIKRHSLWTACSRWFYKTLMWIDFFVHRHVRVRGFTFNGCPYPYFVHLYNTTWKCERAVEIPIVMRWISSKGHSNVLEIGNVLSHYFDFKHDIVDKYEKAEGVINVDVLDFVADKRYDLIVAISTLEHIGWDEKPRDPEKILGCIRHLKKLLSKGGTLILTVPAGYNSYLDDIIRERAIEQAQFYHFKRTGRIRWVQSEFKDIDGLPYGSPWGAANALTIVSLTNQ